MMFRRSAYMTPDGSVVWKKQRTPQGTLYLAPDAPTHAACLLRQSAATIGEHIGSGRHGVAYRVGSLVVKEIATGDTEKPGSLPAAQRARHSGIEAQRFVVALSEGLGRIGDKATLRNGARLTAPTYFGSLIGPQVSRTLMTYEPGEGVYMGSRAAGTHSERIQIFDAALQSVGAEPPRLGLYDDIPSDKSTNLLARVGADGPEVVMLDASPLTP